MRGTCGISGGCHLRSSAVLAVLVSLLGPSPSWSQTGADGAKPGGAAGIELRPDRPCPDWAGDLRRR